MSDQAAQRPRTAQAEVIPSIEEIIRFEQSYVSGDVARLQEEHDKQKDMLARKQEQLRRYEEIIAAHRVNEQLLERNVGALKRMLIQRQQLHLTMLQDNL